MALSSAGLSSAAASLLGAMASGATLKVHRTLDGAKEYRLHPLDGPAATVDAALVTDLLRRGVLQSNMKFPAATFILTENGRAQAAKVVDSAPAPLTSRNYATGRSNQT